MSIDVLMYFTMCHKTTKWSACRSKRIRVHQLPPRKDALFYPLHLWTAGHAPRGSIFPVRIAWAIPHKQKLRKTKGLLWMANHCTISAWSVTHMVKGFFTMKTARANELLGLLGKDSISTWWSLVLYKLRISKCPDVLQKWMSSQSLHNIYPAAVENAWHLLYLPFDQGKLSLIMFSSFLNQK